MSFFIALLIILLVWFFLIAPFVRLISVSRQWRDAFSNATRRQQQSRQQQQQTRKPKYPKKKIDPNVGEYVEFTETTSSNPTNPTATNTRTSAETEAQITDVTWEDLPD